MCVSFFLSLAMGYFLSLCLMGLGCGLNSTSTCLVCKKSAASIVLCRYLLKEKESGKKQYSKCSLGGAVELPDELIWIG